MLNSDYKLESGTDSIEVRWEAGQSGTQYFEYYTLEDDEPETWENIDFVIEKPVGNAVILKDFDTTTVWIYRNDEGPTEYRLMKARNHPIVYYLSFPRGYKADHSGPYPLVFAIDGNTGYAYRQMIDQFRDVRGDLPFILVTPVTFSNGGYTYPSMGQFYSVEEIAAAGSNKLKFDEEGILAIQDDIRKLHHGKEKFFISGHSGGGLATWRMIGRHPEKLYAGAPTCPNFRETIFDGAPPVTEPADGGPPVVVFQGRMDPHIVVMDREWDVARAVFDEHAFLNIERTIVEGFHEAFPNLVLEYFWTIGRSSCCGRTGSASLTPLSASVDLPTPGEPIGAR